MIGCEGDRHRDGYRQRSGRIYIGICNISNECNLPTICGMGNMLVLVT